MVSEATDYRATLAEVWKSIPLTFCDGDDACESVSESAATEASHDHANARDCALSHGYDCVHVHVHDHDHDYAHVHVCESEVSRDYARDCDGCDARSGWATEESLGTGAITDFGHLRKVLLSLV